MNLTDYPTPRTDKNVTKLSKTPDCFCEAEHARQLEREAAAWRAVAEKYRRHFYESDIRIANEAFDALKSQLNEKP